jgi:glycosyltransferase involved in cell wall biosynthesis
MLSIIIPTYKRPAKLRRALSSIKVSNPNDIEVIVIDDDPDMSAAQIIVNYPFVRYFAKRGIDRGLSRSRNIGIEFARNEFLVFLDDDDYFTGISIEFLLSKADEMFDFYYGDYYVDSADGIKHKSLKHISYDHLLVCNQIPVGTYMIRKTVVKEFFDVLMKSHEDWLFILANVEWKKSQYLHQPLVVIDKKSTENKSMQERRRHFFCMEFMGIYSKFPAPKLASHRKSMLATLGIDVPLEILESEDCF